MYKTIFSWMFQIIKINTDSSGTSLVNTEKINRNKVEFIINLLIS